MFSTVYKVTSPRVVEEFVDVVEDIESKVLVKVDVMAICKADIRYFLGAREKSVLEHKYPLAPIHEAVGHVVKDPTGTFKKGDKVILIPNSVDERYYTDPENRRCQRPDLGENYYSKATFRSSTTDGFMREYYTASPDLLVKYGHVPANLAVFSELLSVASAALRRINFNEVKKLALFGDGIMAYIVYIDLTQDHPELDLTVFGIDQNKLALFKDAKTTTFEEYKGEKFDTLIECVGGKFSEDAINNMISLAIPGADLILMGVSEDKVLVNTRVVLDKGLSLKGVTRSTREDFIHASNIIQDKKSQEKLSIMVLSENKINSVIDIYRCYEEEINNKTKIGKNLLVW
ncbi:MAG: alcohol dehydrogenase catalytic domain-containing protein [Bacilli bacterium]|nr:alcohol dehydrogenase catalytic domain-containing protein [Bacilli bacterium]